MREPDEPERNGRKQPAYRGYGERWDLATDGAADNVVAGPEQRGEREQQVGVVVNPAALGRDFFVTGHRAASQQSTAARVAALLATGLGEWRNIAGALKRIN